MKSMYTLGERFSVSTSNEDEDGSGQGKPHDIMIFQNEMLRKYSKRHILEQLSSVTFNPGEAIFHQSSFHSRILGNNFYYPCSLYYTVVPGVYCVVWCAVRRLETRETVQCCEQDDSGVASSGQQSVLRSDRPTQPASQPRQQRAILAARHSQAVSHSAPGAGTD